MLLYEGYTANLLDIVDELKEMKDCPVEVYKITLEVVRVANRARRRGFRHRSLKIDNFVFKRTSKKQVLK